MNSGSERLSVSHVSSGFTWSRYGEMKKMVKAAVRDYKVLSVEQLVAAKTRANRTSNIAQETSDVDDVPAGK